MAQEGQGREGPQPAGRGWLGLAYRYCPLLVLATSLLSLQGCCSRPRKQLTEWEPNTGDFRKKAEWISENGVWLGNPSWRFHMELEVEDYECLAMDSNKPVCVVWTLHEWNCNEHDFGICKCQVIAHEGDYCAEWGCHALEADQQICWEKDDDSNEVQCHYDHFPMDRNTYERLMDNQANGGLTTGERLVRWWSFTNAWDDYRRLQAAQDPLDNAARSADQHAQGNASKDVGQQQQARALYDPFVHVMWPPPVAFAPGGRHLYFHWGDVCIVNGDNIFLARRRCHRWREIETEISHCQCLEAAPTACRRWSCEERDVGLFSVLFRMQDNIAHLTEGTEQENYTCKVLGQHGCVAWEGDIASVEEVEWTRCECLSSSCHDVGAKWRCDEYELPKRRSWNHASNIGRILAFIFVELAILFCFCNALSDIEEALPAAVCLSSCGGCIVLPFLVVTFGAYGFLALGLPFWLLRCCCCAIFVGKGAAASVPKAPVKERFQRGTSKVFGRSASYQTRVESQGLR